MIKYLTFCGGKLIFAFYITPEEFGNASFFTVSPDFVAVLMINRVSILAILVVNSEWFLHSSLELGMFLRRGFTFSPLAIRPTAKTLKANVSAATVKNKDLDVFGQLIIGRAKIADFGLK